MQQVISKNETMPDKAWLNRFSISSRLIALLKIVPVSMLLFERLINLQKLQCFQLKHLNTESRRQNDYVNVATADVKW